MTIKEVGEKYGISQDTLRYYERVGMIPAVTRTPGGIRDYQESDLKWVELAGCMRSAGLPVEAIIEYVKLYQEGIPPFPRGCNCWWNKGKICLNNGGGSTRRSTGSITRSPGMRSRPRPAG